MRKKKHLEERLAAQKDILFVLESREFYKKSMEEKTALFDLGKLFGNDNPVEIEFGCGRGRFIVETAKRFPERNFIGVEKLSNIIVAAAEKAAAAGLGKRALSEFERGKRGMFSARGLRGADISQFFLPVP